MNTNFRKSIVTAVMSLLLVLPPSAQAGPPAICHPFEVGAAPVLPWESSHGWNSPAPSYDTRHIIDDTLALLAPAAPIVARMENIRRATIYAGHDPELAATLLRAVIARVDWNAAPDQRDPLAWFDAGYLLETYRQWHVAGEFDMSSVEADWLSVALGEFEAHDGYAMLRAAIAAADGDPAMEFAASLVVRDNAASLAHRQRAAARATAGSLLALNLGR